MNLLHGPQLVMSSIAMLFAGCASSPRAGSEGGAAAGADAELSGLIDELFSTADDETGAPIALATEDEPFVAAVVDTWREEGMGAGRGVAVFSEYEADEPIEISAPGADPEDAARRERAREALLKRFRGRTVERLHGLAWPGSDEEGEPLDDFELLDLGVSIRRDEGKLRFVGEGGRENAVLDLEDVIDEGYRAVPTMVYARSGSAHVLVSVRFDPGEAYAEGFDVHTTTYYVHLRE